MKILNAVACALAVSASACGTIDDLISTEDSYTKKIRRVHLAGASPLFEGDEFERIDLVSLLDPEGRHKDLSDAQRLAGNSPSEGGFFSTAFSTEPSEAAQSVQLAFRAFYSYQESDTQRAVRRNAIQDRLMGSSEHTCHVFKNYLSLESANNNFLFGSLSTIFGASASVFSDIETVRALAAMAGISSGIRAEFNQAYLQNLTLDVITRGIDLRRKRLREEIGLRRGTVVSGQGASQAAADNTPSLLPQVAPARTAADIRPIELYTIEEAVYDSVRYHASCSIVAGLEEAADSIKQVEDPGIAAVKRILDAVQSLPRPVNDQN